MDKCVICCESESQLVKLTNRGKTSLAEFAKLRENTNVLSLLDEEGEHYVHETCRKWFNNKKRILSEKNSTEQSKKHKLETRRSVLLFKWKENCFLCGKNVGNRKEWHSAQTLTIRETIVKNCEKRLQKKQYDAWAMEVEGRVNNCVDFVAVEARYHQNCRVLFSTGGNLNSNKVAGRRSNTTLTNAFEKACEWLEEESELHSVSEFAAKVDEFAETDAYTNKYLTTLLQRKYGDHVIINHAGPGKENVILFQNTARFLIEEKYKEKEGDINDEKKKNDQDCWKSY